MIGICSYPKFLLSILIFNAFNAFAQCDLLSKDYTSNTGFTTVGSAVTIGAGKVLFNEIPGQSDHRVYTALNSVLGNAWIAEFDFNPQNGDNVGVAVSLFCLTAGNQKPYKDPPYTPATPMTNQDFIEVNLFSPHNTPNYITETKIYAACKDNSNIPISSSPIDIPEWNKNYYARIERASETQGFLSIFSDAARTNHIIGSPICFAIPETIYGLNTLQHANVSQADEDRLFTGWVDNSCIKSNPLVLDPYDADFIIHDTYCYGTTLSTITNAPNVSNQWNLYECDANCNVLGPEITYFTGNSISIQLTSPLFQAGHYYLIKHGTWSDCSPWQESKKCFLVMISPIANAGPDLVLCPMNNGNQKMGTPGTILNKYSWSPAYWLNSSKIQQPKPTLPTNILPCVSQTYTLTVTNTINGCASSDLVKVTLINQPPSITIQSTPCEWCEAPTLTANIAGSCNNSLIWMPGGETLETINASSNGIYSATVSNECFSNSSSINISIPSFSGQIPELAITNAMTTTSPWAAFEINKPISYTPAYNATEYNLKIFDRWGNKIHEQGNTVDCAGAFSNGDITWNGICSSTGNYPSLATYAYILTLKNCNTSKSFSGEINFIWRLAQESSETLISDEKFDSFIIYPNPTTVNSFILLKNIQLVRDQILEILTIEGNLIHSESITINNELRIELNDIPAGIYFVRIRNKNYDFLIAKKLIIIGDE